MAVAALLDPSFLTRKPGASLTTAGASAGTIREVIERARESPFTVQSDFARQRAVHVGIAASYGYITTIDRDMHCRHWLVTRAGMHFLEGCDAGALQ